MEGLKMCPVCGRAPEKKSSDMGCTWIMGHRVKCTNPECTARPKTERWDKEEGAVTEWNRMADSWYKTSPALNENDALRLYRELLLDMQKALGDDPMAGPAEEFAHEWACARGIKLEGLNPLCHYAESICGSRKRADRCRNCLVYWPRGKCRGLNGWYLPESISEVLEYQTRDQHRLEKVQKQMEALLGEIDSIRKDMEAKSGWYWYPEPDGKAGEHDTEQ